MSAIPTVFVVDDDTGVRESLIFLIKTAGMNVEAYPSAEDFLRAYRPERCGCLVLDLSMPGMNGHDLQAELAKRNFMLPVIFLTALIDIPTAVRAIQAGAMDFLTKPVNAQSLLERVHAAILLDVRRRERLQAGPENHLAGLTPRELEIAHLLTTGSSNKEIARKLGISHRTVENHRARVMEKTQTNNLIELTRLIESHNSTVS